MSRSFVLSLASRARRGEFADAEADDKLLIPGLAAVLEMAAERRILFYHRSLCLIILLLPLLFFFLFLRWWHRGTRSEAGTSRRPELTANLMEALPFVFKSWQRSSLSTGTCYTCCECSTHNLQQTLAVRVLEGIEVTR